MLDPLLPTPKLRMYLASPLFSEAELTFNKKLKSDLSEFFTVYLPQEDGFLLVDALRRGEDASEAAHKIFVADTTAINESDVVLAVLDGRTIDEGVAFELGYAYAIGKLCVGLQTDPRRLLPTGNNPMLQQALQQIFRDAGGLMEWAAEYVERHESAGVGNDATQNDVGAPH